MNEFGNRLKNLRLEKGLSVADVAERIQVSPSTYRDWEYGRAIKGEPYIKLAQVFDISLNQLLSGEVPKVEQHLQELEKIIGKIRMEL